MPQIIDVPGQGQVEFPDGMSDEDIVKAIQANQPEKQSPVAAVAAPVARGLAKGVAAPVGMVPDLFMRAMNLEQFPMSAPEFGETGENVPHYPTERTASLIDKIMTRLGVPKTQSKPQQFLESAVEGAAAARTMASATPSIPKTALTVGGAVGGVAGETARQLGAPLPVQIAAEVAGNVAGGRVAMPRAAGTKTEQKLAQELTEEGKLQQMADNYAAAKKEGIDLNIAEASDSGRIKQAAAKATGQKGDPSEIDAFNTKRTEQVKAATQRFFDLVEPNGVGAETAGAAGRTAAKEAIDVVKAKRKAAVDPLYEKAFETKSRVSKATYDELSRLYDEPGFGDAVKKARTQLEKSPDAYEGTTSKNKLLTELHRTKMLFSDQIGAIDRGVEGPLTNVNRADATRWKGIVEKALEEVSPKNPKTGKSYYSEANETFANLSPRVDKIKEGGVGRLAEATDEELAQAPKKLFNKKHGPVEVSRAFADIKARDPEAANQMLRSYLGELFDDAVKSSNSKLTNSQRGNKWAHTVTQGAHGDMLKATLSKKQYQAFDSLTQVLKNTGNFTMAGSDAKWLSASQKANDLVPDAIASAQSSLGWKRFVINMADRLVEGKANKEIAKLMTDPEGVEKVLAAQKLPPRSKEIALMALIRSYGDDENGSE